MVNQNVRIGSSNNSMTGLNFFIADLRNSQESKSEQDKRINSELIKIKTFFDSTNTSLSVKSNNNQGYNLKKNISKLIYIYITSNTSKLDDIKFGLKQFLQLSKSNKYSEKFIGYLIISLLYQYETIREKLMELMKFTIINDLNSSNEHFNSLALTFIGIASNFDPQLLNDDTIIECVFRFIANPRTVNCLKQKTCLAINCMCLNIKKFNLASGELHNILNETNIQHFFNLLNDEGNPSIILTALPVLEYYSKNIDPIKCLRIIPHLTKILLDCLTIRKQRSSSTANPSEFILPNPWLITNIINVLNVLIISNNESIKVTNLDHLNQLNNLNDETLGKLRICVTKAIDLNTRDFKTPFGKLIQNIILFKLIKFAGKLNPSDESIENSITALCSLLVNDGGNTNGNGTNMKYLTLDCLIELTNTSGKIDCLRQKNLYVLFNVLKMERDISIIKKIVELIYICTDASNMKLIVNQLLKYILNANCVADQNLKSDISIKISKMMEKYNQDEDLYMNVSLKLLSGSVSGGGMMNKNNDLIIQRLIQIIVNNEHLQKKFSLILLEYLNKMNSNENIIQLSCFIIGEFADLIEQKISIGDLFNLFTTKYFSVSNVTKAVILTSIIKLYKFDHSIGSVVIKFYQLELNSLDIELQTRSYEYLKMIQICKLSGNYELIETLFSRMPIYKGTKVEPPKELISNEIEMSKYYTDQKLSNTWEDSFKRMLIHKQGVMYQNTRIKIIYRMNVEEYTIGVSISIINQTEGVLNGLSSEIIPFKIRDNPEYVIGNNSGVSRLSLQKNERSNQTFDIIIRKPFDIEESPILRVCCNGMEDIVLKLGIGIVHTILPVREEDVVGFADFIRRWQMLPPEGYYNASETQYSGKLNQLLGAQGQEELVGYLQSVLQGKFGFQMITNNSVSNTVFGIGVVHSKTDGNFSCLIKLMFDMETGNVNLSCKSEHRGTLSKSIVDSVLTVI
ncbi:hypothetical protein TBLA_0I02230 [Henningerozyma blattae CBS 6284]|uniref:AP-2 complex subunit alpha n=1 Tax=Henningerozyma blattae (strain ATCC 34711 / CBS 6284 / DSM 70876 / NBRC 10599 / NRRL Y-10934 / UCD 77-7) TaxID=1071380 RepID=I2H929_HENB6|nr:hypothetical protein TBLA_0I02230 [Tetrapisispora blattae CBS 6284]CCH62881.1 hypothetical protein TBLA_0I02230 [Tetrapisispora blattae CBS 6284]